MTPEDPCTVCGAESTMTDDDGNRYCPSHALPVAEVMVAEMREAATEAGVPQEEA